MLHVVDSKDRPSRNYVSVYISQYIIGGLYCVYPCNAFSTASVKRFFRDDRNERGRGKKRKRSGAERERKGNENEKAEAEEKSGRESVDLLLKRPSGNNGRCATRDGCSLQTRTRDT